MRNDPMRFQTGLVEVNTVTIRPTSNALVVCDPLYLTRRSAVYFNHAADIEFAYPIERFSDVIHRLSQTISV